MRIDTTDMHAIHKVFRLACRDAPVAFARTEGEGRVSAVGTFYETVLGFLHCHHGAEDALLFPLLSRRCPTELTLLTRMETQHEVVNVALARAEALLGRWRTNPGRHERTEAVSAIGVLGGELGRHMEEEETHVLPLAAVNLTLEEWEALPRHAMTNFPSDKKWLMQGLVREQMSEAQLAHMTKSMPPLAIETWQSMGSPRFAAFMASIRAAP
jgi:hypothetical protein